MIRNDFYDGDSKIGSVFIRLKRGWNQLHISVEEEFQKQGYGSRMIEEMVEKYGYVSVPESRIVNKNFTKLLDKLDKKKYSIGKTKFDEYVIYRVEDSIPEVYEKDIEKTVTK